MIDDILAERRRATDDEIISDAVALGENALRLVLIAASRKLSEAARQLDDDGNCVPTALAIEKGKELAEGLIDSLISDPIDDGRELLFYVDGTNILHDRERAVEKINERIREILKGIRL